MKNNQTFKQEIQLELPCIQTGHYQYMNHTSINFPLEPKEKNINKDTKELSNGIQLSIAM